MDTDAPPPAMPTPNEMTAGEQQQRQQQTATAKMNMESAIGQKMAQWLRKFVAVYSKAIGSGESVDQTLERWETNIRTMDLGDLLRGMLMFPLTNPLALLLLPFVMPFLLGIILLLIPGFCLFLISCLLIPAIFVVPSALFVVLVLDQLPKLKKRNSSSNDGSAQHSGQQVPNCIRIFNWGANKTATATNKEGRGEGGGDVGDGGAEHMHVMRTIIAQYPASGKIH